MRIRGVPVFIMVGLVLGVALGVGPKPIPVVDKSPIDHRQFLYVPIACDLFFAAPEIDNIDIPPIEKRSEITGKQTIVSIPKDAQFMQVIPLTSQGCWGLLVAHESYPRVPFGKLIPVSPLMAYDRSKK